MRYYLASAVLAAAIGLYAPIFAQDKGDKAGDSKATDAAKKDDAKKDDAKKDEAKPKAPAAKREPKLKVGMAPPKLQVDEWLQGNPVPEFEKGKVYVVEFWTTWCGPCIVMMPHLGELQAQYRDKGVTIIGYSKPDQNNSKEKVVEFVKKRGPKLGYTFAYSNTPQIFQDEWLTSAAQRGIPCCFVLNQDTKIAYIGHPMLLDGVLPGVLDGSWTPENAAEKTAELEAALEGMQKALSNTDAEKGIEELAAFDAKYPGFDSIPYFIRSRVYLLLRAKKFDDLKVMARKLMDKAVKAEDVAGLGLVAGALQNPLAKNQPALAELALEAAELGVKVTNGSDVGAIISLAMAYNASGKKEQATATMDKLPSAIEANKADKDIGTLLRVTQAYYLLGNTAKGEEYGQKAIDAAPEAQRSQVEEIVKRFAPKKDEKKDDSNVSSKKKDNNQ